MQHAPDYPRSEFINQQLAGKRYDDRALVFLGHLYYLRVPFLYGDPVDSWAVDPALLRSDDEWRSFLSRNKIRWGVRSGDYPVQVSSSLERLEKESILTPCASGTVEDFSGNRIGGTRKDEGVTIFCTHNAD